MITALYVAVTRPSVYLKKQLQAQSNVTQVPL